MVCCLSAPAIGISNKEDRDDEEDALEFGVVASIGTNDSSGNPASSAIFNANTGENCDKRADLQPQACKGDRSGCAPFTPHAFGYAGSGDTTAKCCRAVGENREATAPE